MSQGGVMPAYPPVMWVYLHAGDCTVRWQRGDTVAYLFEGRQLETYPDERIQAEPLATVPVSTKGWTDITHVRLTGEQWVKLNKRARCKACGGVS